MMQSYQEAMAFAGLDWPGLGAGLAWGLDWPWLGWLVSELMRSSKTIASLFLKRSSNLFKLVQSMMQ
jgi:hypothetical protein